MARANESAINIRIDENALREQVREIISQELIEASFAFWRIADSLDPELLGMHSDMVEEDLRKKIEGEKGGA